MNPKELAKIKIHWFKKGLDAAIKFQEYSKKERDDIIKEVKQKLYKE